MKKQTEPDWATDQATRIVKGYRIAAGKGRELRDEIAKALRKLKPEGGQDGRD